VIARCMKYQDPIRIAVIRPQQAAKLIEELDSYLMALYPAESNHLETVESLSREDMVMVGVVGDRELCAIGAVKLHADYGELKRVYVPPAHRGKGFAKAIMRELESLLVKRGIRVAMLETGIYQDEAVGLYRKLGYQERGPFGHYGPDPFSVFMQKRLSDG
jgi:putative acetyltransferase